MFFWIITCVQLTQKQTVHGYWDLRLRNKQAGDSEAASQEDGKQGTPPVSFRLVGPFDGAQSEEQPQQQVCSSVGDETVCGVWLGGMEGEVKIVNEPTSSLFRVSCRIPGSSCWSWVVGQSKEREVKRKRFLQFTLDQRRGKGGLHRSSIAEFRMRPWRLDLEGWREMEGLQSASLLLRPECSVGSQAGLSKEWGRGAGRGRSAN